jgi:hypothetical protein
MLYDLSNLSQVTATRTNLNYPTIVLNPDCTRIFALKLQGNDVIATCFYLITPKEEKMLTDLKNKLTIEQALLIITLNQELIRGNKIQLSDSDNTIYTSLPAEIQILFANVIQKD